MRSGVCCLALLVSLSAPALGQGPIRGVAVVIGIDDYQPDAGFWRLKHAAADANDFGKRLQAQDYRVEFLTDAKATYSTVRSRVEQGLELARTSNVVFVFFFAGHGGETPEHKQFLALYETDSRRLEQTAYPLDVLLNTMSGAKGIPKAVFIDACRDQPPEAASTRGATPRRALQAFSRIPQTSGIYLINAAGPGRQSYEDDDVGHGFFTLFLLKGLTSGAVDDTGRITLNRLFDYVHDNVKDFAAKKGLVQEPLRSELDIGDSDIVLGRRQTENLAAAPSLQSNPFALVLLSPSAQVRKSPELSALHEARFRAFQEIRFDDALRLADQLVAKLPDDPAQRMARGWILIQRQNFPGAESDATWLVTRDPKSDDAVYLHALALYNQKRFAEAKNDVDTVLARNSEYAPAYYTRATIGFATLQPDIVVRDMTEYANRMPPQPDVFFLRANAYYSLGQAAKAIADFNTVLELQPGNYTALMDRGDMRVAAGDIAGALADYDETIRIAPAFAGGYYSRSRFRSYRGEYAAALDDINKAVELAPAVPANYIQRAQVESALGHAAEAELDLKKARELGASQKP